VSFIQVKHVSPALHAVVRERAAEEDVTVSDYVLDPLWRDLSLPSHQQWLARVASRQTADAPAVSLLDVVRTEHEDEMGRTAP
jgi:hypothetical protein